MCVSMAMLTAAAQRARPSHGVALRSLRLDRPQAPLITVRCAVNVWRIKESWKAPVNFCEIVIS